MSSAHTVPRIANAAVFEILRPLRLDIGTEATADRLVACREAVAGNRLLRTPMLVIVPPGAPIFSHNSKVAAMTKPR